MSWTPRQLVTAFVAMVLVIPVAKFLGNFAAEQQNSQDRQNASVAPLMPSDQTIALISRQSSDGVTEADFSPVFLARLGDWIEQRTQANAQKYWDAAGVPAEDRVTSNEPVYIEASPHKLAVVRIRIGNATPNATIVGIVGSEMVRVTCINESGGDVAVTSGACGEKIREAFGVSFLGDSE